MGKKIPKSRRHKKLKFVDPCYSGPPPRRRRKNILPNEPPLEDDYQEVPRQMEELIQLKEKAKSNKFKRKKKKKVLKDEFIIVKKDVIEDNEPGMTMGIKKMPNVIKQRASENENQFFNRLQKMTNQAIAEAKVEEKYNIKLVNIDEKGNAEYVSGEKEVSESKKRKREKYKEIVKEKKKMRAKDEEFDFKKECIQFGEVATAPPILTAKPRKAPEGVKPGKRKLALDQLLKHDEPAEPKSVTIKWKNMSPVRRKVIENERLRAIQMYRLLKNKKSGA